MTTALTVRNADIDLDTLQRTAKMLVASNFFDTKGAVEVAIAQIATKIIAGSEFGFGTFASVNGIHVIQGKPAIGAGLMATAVKRSGRYDYRVKTLTDEVCEIEFFEREGGKRESLGVSTFTRADAVKAGTQNLNKFARNMLFARCISNGIKWFCPDVFSGSVYTPEELGATVNEEGDVIDVTPTVRNQPQPEPEKPVHRAPPQVEPEVNFYAAETEPQPAPQQPAPTPPTKPTGNLITDGQRKQLMMLGTNLYGADKWDDERPKLITVFTNGRSKHTADLTTTEAKTLIDDIAKRLRERPAPQRAAA